MSASVSSAPLTAGGRHQRSVRNYLLDAHFQLKYTSFLVGIAVLLSLSLGTLLWSVSRKVIAESQQTVQQGQETVERGQEVVKESQKVSAVVHMNIIKDPVYGSNPELAAVFNESANEQDRRLEEQQQKLEGDAAALKRRSEDLAHQQTQMFIGLVAVLSLLVFGIGIGGIIITHKISGPVHKMKRLLRNVGDGHLILREKLRKGDELHHFFSTFETMVQSLRQRQEVEIGKLDNAIQLLESHVDLGATRAASQAAPGNAGRARDLIRYALVSEHAVRVFDDGGAVVGEGHGGHVEAHAVDRAIPRELLAPQALTRGAHALALRRAQARESALPGRHAARTNLHDHDGVGVARDYVELVASHAQVHGDYRDAATR